MSTLDVYFIAFYYIFIELFEFELVFRIFLAECITIPDESINNTLKKCLKQF